MNDKGLLDILWSSNSLNVPSGYGTQTKQFLPRLRSKGYGVALAANYGVQGSPFMTQDNILVLPSVSDAALNDIIVGHYQYTKSDLLITLYDPHTYNRDVMNQISWCAWCPVDSTPLAPANAHSLKSAKWIWAMSRHGEAQLRAAGFDNVAYVPHGIDSTIFKPTDRPRARATMNRNSGGNFIDKFVVVANSANKGTPSRKGFYEMLAAFKAFSDARDDAVLYLHTEAMGVFQGEHMPATLEMLHIAPEKVIFPPQYQFVCGMLDENYMVDVYNAADVFLSTSHGEGFGIPIVEAQLSGCPVIVTKSSAMTELCMTGKTIPSTTYMPVAGCTWQRPSVPETVALLEYAYANWRDNESVRAEAREKALVYDAATVFDTYMLPAVEKMQAELYHAIEPQRILRKRKPVNVRSNGHIAELIPQAVA